MPTVGAVVNRGGLLIAILTGIPLPMKDESGLVVEKGLHEYVYGFRRCRVAWGLNARSTPSARMVHLVRLCKVLECYLWASTDDRRNSTSKCVQRTGDLWSNMVRSKCGHGFLCKIGKCAVWEMKRIIKDHYCLNVLSPQWLRQIKYRTEKYGSC